MTGIYDPICNGNPHPLKKKAFARHNTSILCRKSLIKRDPTLQSQLCLPILHPRKLTWTPKIAIFERRYILKTIIFGIYVRFRGCIVSGQVLFVGSFTRCKRSLPSFCGKEWQEIANEGLFFLHASH